MVCCLLSSVGVGKTVSFFALTYYLLFTAENNLAKMYVDNERASRYHGDVLDCIRHGEGRYDYPGGVYSYVGTWNNGVKNGSNVTFTVSGYSTYTGNMVNGEITGKGVKKWIDGKTYEGEWLCGEMNGKGIWTSADGKEQYDGNFVMNKRSGSGYLRLRNGDTYSGTFQDNLFHGKGAYLKEGCFFIESNFENGIVNGNGDVKWHKIAAYSGNIKGGRLSGYGQFSSSDNSFSYQGPFLNGKVLYKPTKSQVSLDRSFFVEPEVSNPTNSKDKKKGSAPKKGEKEDPNMLATVEKGSELGILSVCMSYERTKGLIDSDISSEYNEYREFLDGSKFSFAVYPRALPNLHEARRRLLLKVRRYIPRQIEKAAKGAGAQIISPELLAEELGDTIDLWVRSHTLDETSNMWSRFPSNSYRYMDGVNALSGERLLLESGSSMSTFMHADEYGVMCFSPPLVEKDMQTKGYGEGIVLPLSQFRKSIAWSTSNNSISYLVDFRLNSALLDHDISMCDVDNIQYHEVTICRFSLSTSPSSHIILVLLKPESCAWSEHNWTNCLWDLRLENNAVDSEGSDIPMRYVVCRWYDSLNFNSSNWHSILFSLIVPHFDTTSDEKLVISKCCELVIDGAGRMKKEFEQDMNTNNQPDYSIWFPVAETNLFAGSDNMILYTPLSSLKNIALLNRNDLCDFQQLTSCYSQMYSKMESIERASNEAVADVEIPPNCTVFPQVEIACCGGVGIVSNIIIPKSTLPGVYVVEICDFVNEKCLYQSLDNGQTATTSPGDIEGAVAVTTKVPSTISAYKITVV